MTQTLDQLTGPLTLIRYVNSALTVSVSARKWTVNTTEPVRRASRRDSSVAVPSALRENSVRLTSMTVRTTLARERLHTATISSTTTSASARPAWRASRVSSTLTSVLLSPANTELAWTRSETTSVNVIRDTPAGTAPRTLTTASCCPASTEDRARTWSTTTSAPVSRATRGTTARLI